MCESGFFRETEPVGQTGVCVCVIHVLYYKELAHVILEAEKWHELLSTSGRPRKASLSPKA